MHKYTKWSIAAAVSWVLFFTILFGGVIKKTRVYHEYGCTVQSFNVNPRFDCYKKCSITDAIFEKLSKRTEYTDYTKSMSAEDAFEIMAELGYYDQVTENEYNAIMKSIQNESNGHRDGKGPDCDELENDTLNWYSPNLCLHAKWGLEDPLCPPESATCYTGEKWQRKCSLSCPLAYNVTVTLDVNHIGTIEKNRDLGTNEEKFNSYKTSYVPGEKMTCQVVKGGNGKNDFLFVDERMSHEALKWWKWSLFSGSLFLVLLTTIGSIVSYIRYRERVDNGTTYTPINTEHQDDVNSA